MEEGNTKRCQYGEKGSKNKGGHLLKEEKAGVRFGTWGEQRKLQELLGDLGK